MNPKPPNPADASPRQAPAPATPRPAINWFRFWIQALVAMMVFNVLAGLVTWFFIFPHLHPAH